MNREPGERRPVFTVPFSWNTSIGHLVRLLVDHVEPGLVVQLGAGRAPAAERLRQRGYTFAATVDSSGELNGLHERGMEAVELDLDRADPDDVVLALRSLSTSTRSPVVALLLDGVLDRVADPDRLLAGVARFAEESSAVVGVSVANVAHRAVAVPLLSGRFEPIGPGPHHHSRASLLTRMGAAGLVERHRLDRHAPEVRPSEPYDPSVSQGAQLGSFLHQLRSVADETADVADLVGLFALGVPASPTEAPRTPTLVVLVPSDLDATVRAELDRQIDRQTSSDLELVELGDDPIATLDGLRHPYAVVLSGRERLTDEWADQFLAAVEWYPGAIVRCASTNDAWVAHDSFFGLLQARTAPDAAFAFPTALLRVARSEVAVQDGRLDLHALLLVGAVRCGIVDTGAPVLDVDRPWTGLTPPALHILLDTSPLLVPMGSATYLVGLHTSRSEAHERAIALEDENRALREQLGRRPIGALSRALALVERLRRRPGRR